MLAGIVSTGAEKIDHLVTALPASHFRDEEKRKALKSTLVGAHNVSGGREVVVDDVSVIPQPVGSYMSIVSTFEDAEPLEEGRALVIDPGYFSVDWLTIEGMEARMASSGTSLKAMSKLFKDAASVIGPRVTALMDSTSNSQ